MEPCDACGFRPYREQSVACAAELKTSERGLLVRIVSVNAWCGTMFDDFAAWLPSVGADVVCLQEVPRTPGVSGNVTYVDDERTLDQRADLFADVVDLLPSHQGSFVASDAGPVVTPDGRTHRQEFGLAVFVEQRTPVIGQLAAYVHGDFLDHERWPASHRPRVAQGVRVVDRASERAVSVLHLHGIRLAEGKGDTPERGRQAQRIVEKLDHLRAPGDLAVVCGDLNLLPDSATFETLAAAGLTDLVGTADTRSSRYLKPVRHASYLALSEPEAVKGFEIVADPEVSDHRPLVVDL